MKPLALVLGLVAVALIALGLFLGFRTVYDDEDHRCGSAFKENEYLLPGSSCDKERSDALPLPLAVLTAGVVSAVGSVVASRSSAEPSSEPSAP